jgi:hypothetical protein
VYKVVPCRSTGKIEVRYSTAAVQTCVTSNDQASDFLSQMGPSQRLSEGVQVQVRNGISCVLSQDTVTETRISQNCVSDSDSAMLIRS